MTKPELIAALEALHLDARNEADINFDSISGNYWSGMADAYDEAVTPQQAQSFGKEPANG